MVRGRPGVSRITEPLIWIVRQLARTGQRDIKRPTAGRKDGGKQSVGREEKRKEKGKRRKSEG